jgi:poly-beta-hydroxybutyrate-responsive repressor
VTAPGSDDIADGLPRSYLRPCLLLLLAEGPSHGYDLLERLGRMGLHRADPGGLYRTLRGMERAGLVHSWWEHSTSGPARRTYRVSEEGLEWLHLWAGSLREVHRSLGDYLLRYERVAHAAGAQRPQ